MATTLTPSSNDKRPDLHINGPALLVGGPDGAALPCSCKAVKRDCPSHALANHGRHALPVQPMSAPCTKGGFINSVEHAQVRLQTRWVFAQAFESRSVLKELALPIDPV